MLLKHLNSKSPTGVPISSSTHTHTHTHMSTHTYKTACTHACLQSFIWFWSISRSLLGLSFPHLVVYFYFLLLVLLFVCSCPMFHWELFYFPFLPPHLPPCPPPPPPPPHPTASVKIHSPLLPRFPHSPHPLSFCDDGTWSISVGLPASGAMPGTPSFTCPPSLKLTTPWDFFLEPRLGLVISFLKLKSTLMTANNRKEIITIVINNNNNNKNKNFKTDDNNQVNNNNNNNRTGKQILPWPTSRIRKDLKAIQS